MRKINTKLVSDRLYYILIKPWIQIAVILMILED